MTMDDLKAHLIRRVKHARKRAKQLEEAHGDKPGQSHTYWGGKDLGYWSGIVTAIENTLDEIDENWEEELE